jgi:hemolysin activation/secretion protein
VFSLYGAAYGQIASKNLDISEKMVLGGPYGVRAYPVGEAYGDEGYIATLEGKVLLPSFSDRLPGQMHAVAFVDTGSVRTNEEPWAPGPNRRTLSGAGVGFTWTHYNNFVVKAYYAWLLDHAESAPTGPGAAFLGGSYAGLIIGGLILLRLLGGRSGANVTPDP